MKAVSQHCKRQDIYYVYNEDKKLKDCEKNKILVSIVVDFFPSFKFLYVIFLAYSFLNYFRIS